MWTKTQAAVVLAAMVAMTAAGCDVRATEPTKSSVAPRSSSPAAHGVTTAAPSAVRDEPAEPIVVMSPEASSTTTTVAAPALGLDEIDELLADVDETLLGLDQLMNQVAAAMAAEEGEIIP